MNIKSKLEKLEGKAKSRAMKINFETEESKTFMDYFTKVLNAEDDELTEGELEVKRKVAELEKNNIKDFDELGKIIMSDEFYAFKEGLLEILMKVKARESFETGREKQIKEKLNKEFRESITIKRKFEEYENKQKALYKEQTC